MGGAYIFFTQEHSAQVPERISYSTTIFFASRMLRPSTVFSSRTATTIPILPSSGPSSSALPAAELSGPRLRPSTSLCVLFSLPHSPWIAFVEWQLISGSLQTLRWLVWLPLSNNTVASWNLMLWTGLQTLRKSTKCGFYNQF